MTFSVCYTHDAEFQKLLSRVERVDMAVLGLEIARDAYPRLEFGPTLAWIEERVREIVPGLARASNDREVLQAIVDNLAGTHDLRGDETCFIRSDSSYLNRIVETRRGIPIGLSLVYLAVAGRLGVALEGVCAPMHFLTRYESAEGPLFLDAYAGGVVRDFDETASWIAEISGWSVDDAAETLQPAGGRAIAIRVLNNLKSLFATTENWEEAWKVQQRLSALQPASYEQRRDLALIASRSQRPGIALDLLESCLRNGPADDQSVIKNELKLAHASLSQWN